jgi:heme O synthase-like polyprenyltransferase
MIPLILAGYFISLISLGGAIGMVVLTSYFIWKAWTFFKDFDKSSARALMFSSFIYLPLALMILLWSM